MSTSLLVMTPFVLLAIVSSLCFVGCVLQTGGLGGNGGSTTVTQYSDVTVLADDRLLAYWRLNEVSGPTAVNAKNPGTADGKYVNMFLPKDVAVNSAEAPGTLDFNQPGMLQGDLKPPHDAASGREPCISVNGGWVAVEPHSSIRPTEAEGFTLEAWVNVGWGDKEEKADRVVVSSVESTGGFRGFGLLAAMNDTWQAIIGDGSGAQIAIGPAPVSGEDRHLVVTYAMGTLKLYVNGVQSGTASGTYVPTTAGRLLIGAGFPQLPEPRAPYVGKVQCVSLYSGAFSDGDVVKHFKNGTGTSS